MRYDGVVKSFAFNHSYFTASLQASEEDYRLRLDGITITGNDPTTTEPQEYTFTYFGDGKLPSRKSLSIDYSGYYNGKSNSSLIPSYTDEVWGSFSGANREPDFTYKTRGILQEMHYPTGGSTSFEFAQSLVGTTTEIHTNSQSLASVRAGADPNANEADFTCDDGFWHWPHTQTSTFTVGDNELYDPNITKYTFKVQKDGNPNQSGRVFFMVIYKSNNSNGSTPRGNTFCDIKTKVDNATIDIVYSGYAVPNNNDQLLFIPDFVNTTKRYLEAGTYTVFMANSLDGVSVSLSRTYIEKVEVDKWNGTPYLSTIVDKTNQGETYIKHLEYLESNVKQQVQLHNFKETQDNTSPDCYASGNNGIYETLERHTSNLYSAAPYEITYPKVRETVQDTEGNTLGSTLYEFYDQTFYVTTQPYTTTNNYNPVIGQPYIENNPLNGQLKQVSHYDNSGRILKSNRSVYDFESKVVTTGTNFYGGRTILDACTVAIPGEINPNLKKMEYWATTDLGGSGNTAEDLPGKVCSSSNGNIVVGGWNTATGYSDKSLRFYALTTKMKETLSNEYRYDASGKKDSIVQKTVYTYGAHHNLPVAVITTLNKGNTSVTNTQYPQDLQSPTAAEQGLIAQHRIATPIRVEQIEKDKDNNPLSTQTQYIRYANNWGNNRILPEAVQTSKNGGASEDRIQYHSYDSQGNPIEVSQANGASIVYIWGYHKQYPIAKIQNATYSEVEQYVADLTTKSNADKDRTRQYTGLEGALRQGLDNLRAALPNAMVTTYTYDPLIGVTSMTDPKGYTVYYEYDDFGRLAHVRDAEENITNKYYYHYASTPFAAVSVHIGNVANWILTGSSLNLQSDITGGSGDFTYAWKITKPGNQITQSSSKNVSLQGGSTAGMTTIELTVKDKVTGVTKTITKSISIYKPLSVSASSISRPATHVVKNTASFNISPTGGAGSYSYSWKIRKGSTSYTTTKKSFSLTMGCAYYGQVQVECTVRDATTGTSKTVTTTMNVVEPAQLTLSLASMPPISSAPRTQKFQVVPNVNGGLGDYSYTWYVNGSRVSTSSSIYITLYCGTTSSSATVSCKIIDRCTGRTFSTRGQTYTISSARCRGTGGGGSGGGKDTNQ